MNEQYMYHGSQRVRVLQTNAVTCVVQIGGNPPYNVNKKELTPDIPVIAELRKPSRLTVEVKRLVLVNGTPIEDLSLEYLYKAIRDEEEATRHMQTIANAPKALLGEIDERIVMIRRLVEAMNEVYP